MFIQKILQSINKIAVKKVLTVNLVKVVERFCRNLSEDGRSWRSFRAFSAAASHSGMHRAYQPFETGIADFRHD